MNKAARIVLLCYCVLFAININHRIKTLEHNNQLGIQIYSQVVRDNAAYYEQLEKVVVASALRESRNAVQDYLSKSK